MVAVFYYLDSKFKWRVLCDSGFMTMALDSLIPAGVTSEELLAHAMNFDHPKVVVQLIFIEYRCLSYHIITSFGNFKRMFVRAY